MRLLEYQAKSLFADYGIPIPQGLTSTTIEQGRKDAEKLGFPFVIKAQMAVGGRGKAGAIQKCQNADEFELKYPEIMQKVVKGERTKAILLEKMADIKKELYLSLFFEQEQKVLHSDIFVRRWSRDRGCQESDNTRSGTGKC